MQVVAYKTDVITPQSGSLGDVVVAALPALAEGSVVAVSSKIAGICEGRLVPIGSIDKDELIKQEAERYLPRSVNPYQVSFTITHGLLVPTAGIDESNGNGNYALWPKDPQDTANRLRKHLTEHFGVQDVGVVLTDSIVRPMRWGVTGLAIAASGFEGVEDAIGKPDLFGRPLELTKTSVQDGLAAVASLVMGEAAQQTPVALITDIPFVHFTRRDPSAEELAALVIKPEEDLYAPFLMAAPWEDGGVSS